MTGDQSLTLLAAGGMNTSVLKGGDLGEHTTTVLKYASYCLSHLQQESIHAFCVIKNVQKHFQISKQKEIRNYP